MVPKTHGTGLSLAALINNPLIVGKKEITNTVCRATFDTTALLLTFQKRPTPIATTRETTSIRLRFVNFPLNKEVENIKTATTAEINEASAIQIFLSTTA